MSVVCISHHTLLSIQLFSASNELLSQLNSLFRFVEKIELAKQNDEPIMGKRKLPTNVPFVLIHTLLNVLYEKVNTINSLVCPTSITSLHNLCKYRYLDTI